MILQAISFYLSAYVEFRHAAYICFYISQVDIVVGTPGRLDDLVSTGKLNLSQVRFLVLDEAVSSTLFSFILYFVLGRECYARQADFPLVHWGKIFHAFTAITYSNIYSTDHFFLHFLLKYPKYSLSVVTN